MRISLRRVLLAATITGGMVLAGAGPAVAQDLGDLGDVTDPVLGQDEEGLLEPVNDLLCDLLELELLGECGDEVVPPPPVAAEKPRPDKPVGGKHEGGKGVSGDAGVAPVGGVETGAGGTADDGTGLVLPLSVLGGAALTGGAIAGARRLRGSSQDG